MKCTEAVSESERARGMGAINGSNKQAYFTMKRVRTSEEDQALVPRDETLCAGMDIPLLIPFLKFLSLQ